MTDGADGGKATEVSFAVNNRSRAAMANSFDRFAVYGDMKFMGETPSSPIVTFDKVEVVKTDGGWQYQGTRYWFHNHEHSFVAVYPLSVLEDAQYADSKLSFSYTLPESNDDAIDIIAATHRRLYKETDANNVTIFNFGHLLSLINFTVEISESSPIIEDGVKIHKLEMSGFGNTATFNLKPASRQSNSQTDDSDIDITTTPGNGSLEINFIEPIEVTNGSTIKMFDGNNALIMLPQVFAAGDKVEFVITYTEGDEGEETRVTATLSDFSWESGMSYNYKIILDIEAKEVNLKISNATITPWALIDDHGEVDAR